MDTLQHGRSANLHVADSQITADAKMVGSSGKGDIGVLDSTQITDGLAEIIAKALWARSGTVRKKLGSAVDNNGDAVLQFEGTDLGDLVVSLRRPLKGWIGTSGSDAVPANFDRIAFQRMTVSMAGTSTAHWIPIGRRL